MTQAENQAVPKVMVLTGKGAALEVQSPPPSETTRGTPAPACGGADDGTRVCVAAARSCLFANLWTVARQAPLPMGILQTRMLQWVAMPTSRGIFPTQGIEPGSPALQADSLLSEPAGKPQLRQGTGK